MLPSVPEVYIFMKSSVPTTADTGIIPPPRAFPSVTKSALLPLSGKIFVITGRLEAFTRQQAEAKIKELGGAAKDNVTRQTDYVVYGVDPGSKLTRANELGIKTLNEKEFLEILKKAKA